MRWLLNGILVLAGVPLAAMTLGLLVLFAAPAADDFNRSEHILLFGSWLFFFALFVCTYGSRTGWLERTGIYRSWSDFRVYMIENHGHPPISEDEKTEFLSWAGLTEKRPPQLGKVVGALYGRIQAEIASEERRRSYIKCLVWYVQGRPDHEDYYDPYDDPTTSWP